MFKIVYGIGFVLIFVIRVPYWVLARRVRVTVDHKTLREKVLLGILSVGIGVLPLIYIFTSLLRFADYQLPSWVGWIGAAAFALGLWLLWRAHAALGRYWSDSVQLRQGHELRTSGVYRHIRHPMYAFGWLLGIAQALLLWNWIVGLSGILSFALLYFVRVPEEEQMMLEHFGHEYREYMQTTGRVVPRVRRAREDGSHR